MRLLNGISGTHQLLFSILLLTTVQVDAMPRTTPLSIFSPQVISLSLGGAWENNGDTQTRYLTPTIEKTYKAHRTTHGLINAELFMGNEWCLPHRLQGQLGLTLAATNDATLSGNIWDDADPQFNNYQYHYEMQHTHLAVKAKLLTDRYDSLLPWVSVSMGVAFNRAHHFNSRPTIFEAVPTPDFKPNMSTAFTYTLGFGIQRKLNDHWQVGIGYEFADWGKGHLARADEQCIGTGLTLNHLYTNSILINLTSNA